MPKFIFALMALLLITTGANAHKVVSSVWLDGPVIEGEIGFSNGVMALEGVTVEVYDQADNKIGESTIGKEGLFRFQPEKSVTHIFRANLGAGHVAIIEMKRNELPSHLRGENINAPSISKSQMPEAIQTSPDLEQLIRKAVREETQPLRKEIAAYKEKNDLQTILGGIGYILGLCGIGFYMAARKKEKQNQGPSS